MRGSWSLSPTAAVRRSQIAADFSWHEQFVIPGDLVSDVEVSHGNYVRVIGLGAIGMDSGTFKADGTFRAMPARTCPRRTPALCRCWRRRLHPAEPRTGAHDRSNDGADAATSSSWRSPTTEPSSRGIDGRTPRLLLSGQPLRRRRRPGRGADPADLHRRDRPAVALRRPIGGGDLAVRDRPPQARRSLPIDRARRATPDADGGHARSTWSPGGHEAEVEDRR